MCAFNPITVTFMRWKGHEGETRTFNDQASLGRALIHEYNIRGPKEITSCNTCHR
jgi:hypothetical protein